MHRPMLQKVFIILLHQLLNNFTASITIASIKSKIESRLIKCMAFILNERGLSVSFFLRYKYSAICCNIPIGIIIYVTTNVKVKSVNAAIC